MKNIHEKSVLLPTRNDPRNFKAVYRPVWAVLGMFKTTPFWTKLTASVGYAILCMDRSGWGTQRSSRCRLFRIIIPGKSFPHQGGSSYHWFSGWQPIIDGFMWPWNSPVVCKHPRSRKLGAQVLITQEEDPFINPGDKPTFKRLTTLLQNVDFPFEDADGIDYKDVEVGQNTQRSSNSRLKIR